MMLATATGALRGNARILSTCTSSRIFATKRLFSTQPLISDIDPQSLVISRTESRKPIPPADELVFGQTFTDHMLMIPWNVKTGWSRPAIVPYGPLQLDPSSMVLHYAPTLFEGLKAYRNDNDKVLLFRPDKNMQRMNTSAQRIAFPTFTGDNFVECIKQLVNLDKAWIPNKPGYSLYIRPTMIGTQAGLGVGASESVLLFVICSPVGPYYKTGFKPVKLLASTKYSRAFHGGTGSYKLGANYIGGVMPAMEAAEQGYQQVLWLQDGDHISEVGTMNIFVAFDKGNGRKELITPPLGDTILPGVTRDSILALARGEEGNGFENVDVVERQVSMREIQDKASKGQLCEIFGAGTAAIVSPVSEIGYQGNKIDVPVGPDGLGPIAKQVLAEITGRQTGKISSSWSVSV